MKRALVISLICVLGLTFAGMAATLSGEWDTTVTIDPAESDFAAAITLTSDITVVYTVGAWAFTSVTSLSDAGWVDQTFAASGVLGAFSASSALDLDVTGAFDSWTTSADVSIAGVNLGATFLLALPTIDVATGVAFVGVAENDVALTITAGGTAGEVDIDIEVLFGDIYWDGDLEAYVGAGDGCDLDWNGVTINVGFPFCCAEIDLAIEFDCTGFVSATFTTGGISIPTLPWLFLDIEVMFDLDTGKTFSFDPSFDFGDIACFTLDLDVVVNDTLDGAMNILQLDAFQITGIGLSVDCFGVTFSGYTDFTVDEGDYYEWYTIATTDDACCGPLPFAFDVGFYFLDGSANLFDVSYIEANVELPFGESFLFTMGMELDLEGLGAGFTAWILGFNVTW